VLRAPRRRRQLPGAAELSRPGFHSAAPTNLDTSFSDAARLPPGGYHLATTPFEEGARRRSHASRNRFAAFRRAYAPGWLKIAMIGVWSAPLTVDR
jgi:hypothetical protein